MLTNLSVPNSSMTSEIAAATFSADCEMPDVLIDLKKTDGQPGALMTKLTMCY